MPVPDTMSDGTDTPPIPDAAHSAQPDTHPAARPDTPTRLFDDDPILGRFLGYFPSNRARLLLQGALLYGLPVIILQVIFLNVTSDLARFGVVGLYALIGLAVAWYVLHLWNREVTVYERGFTYRRGSQLGYFRFAEITSLRWKAERVSYFGLLRREVIIYQLRSDYAEVLRVDGLYKNVARLGVLLERGISQTRRPIVEAKLRQGEQVSFGPLALSAGGLHHDDQMLPWADFGGVGIAQGRLVLLRTDGTIWAQPALADLENLMLLRQMLQARSPNATEEAPATDHTIDTHATADIPDDIPGDTGTDAASQESRS